jgi:hypothetical protein
MKQIGAIPGPLQEEVRAAEEEREEKGFLDTAKDRSMGQQRRAG